MNKHRLNMRKNNHAKNVRLTHVDNVIDKYDELFKLFDYLQEEAKNKRLLAEKSNDPNYYYGMVSAFLDVQSEILKRVNKK